jgi:hypothetical protein
MKQIQLAFAALLVFAVPAFAQRPAAPHPPIPRSGPEQVKAQPHPVEPNRNYSDKEGHPNVPHVDGKNWVGHDTGKDDARYHVDHPAGSGAVMYGIWREAVRGASGSTIGTGQWLPPMWPSATGGCGTPTIS